MTIDDIYEAARARGLVLSKRRFSKDYLGRGSNYLADRGFDGCSAGVLVHLHRRLGNAGQPDLQARVLELLLRYQGGPA